tara:strand:+ start:9747 stop:11090 length:1344 start_codon:yes stop_codon:yes gene_type:complete
MILYIIFTASYLFITSEFIEENIYYLFVHLLLYSFYKSKQNFFRFFFFIFGIFSLATPVLIEELARDLNLVISYDHYHYIPESLIYISIYLSILVLTIASFSFFFKKTKPILSNLSISFNGTYINPLVIVLMTSILVLCSYVWLFNIGYLSYIEERPSSPFITIALAFSSLSITLILCLGYMIQISNVANRNLLIFLYTVIIFTTVFIGLSTGSRMALIFPIMALIFNHQDFFSKRLWIFIIFSPLAFFLFTAMGLTRTLQFEVTLSNLYFFITQNNSVLDLGVHIIVDRFNYLRAINEVVVTYSNSFQIHEDYLQNIYGLIPRLFWPDKPIMGVDLNYIGIEMGVTNPDDRATSYGLHFIGESFYQLKWLGLIIAFLQGIILAKIDSIKESTSIVSHVLVFQLTVFTLMTGSLLTFIPELIMLIVPITILSALLNTNKNEKTINSL